MVFIEMPTVGAVIKQKDSIGAVESGMFQFFTSVKAASDIYAPISGKVIEINPSLEGEPSLINSSPYEEGWIAKIELDNAKQVDELMDDAAYAAHTKD